MYFSGCSTVAEIKTEYRRLAMLHHPDRGGDTATMQAINAAYHAALKAADGQTSAGSDGKEHTYRYNEQTEQAVMEALAAILRVKMDAEVWLIGLWIWIQGDTKPVKEKLKELGCMWHSQRACWYWRPPELKRYGKSKGDLGYLASKYGAKGFKTTVDGQDLAA
jgi:hypothetical protein